MRLIRALHRRWNRREYRRKAGEFLAAAQAMQTPDLIDLCAVEIASRRDIPAAGLRGFARALDRYSDQLEREQED